MNRFRGASPTLSRYIQEVEEATHRKVEIAPYPDATADEQGHASLQIGPGISHIDIRFRPVRPLSDESTERAVAHELTHALMVYSAVNPESWTGLGLRNCGEATTMAAESR